MANEWINIALQWEKARVTLGLNARQLGGIRYVLFFIVIFSSCNNFGSERVNKRMDIVQEALLDIKNNNIEDFYRHFKQNRDELDTIRFNLYIDVIKNILNVYGLPEESYYEEVRFKNNPVIEVRIKLKPIGTESDTILKYINPIAYFVFSDSKLPPYKTWLLDFSLDQDIRINHDSIRQEWKSGPKNVLEIDRSK